MKKSLSTSTVIIILSCFLFVGISSTTKAATIFDNYGPAPGYKTSGAVGFSIGPNESYPSIVNVAGPLFVPSDSAYLNYFDVPIWNSHGDETTTMQFDLVTFNEDYSSLSTIETYLLTLGSAGSMDSYSLYSNDNPLLVAGNEYWLLASSPDAVGWLYTTSSDTSAQATSYNGGLNFSITLPEVDRQLALRVDGNPVPIPGALWLLGTGIIGVVGIMKRFKK